MSLIDDLVSEYKGPPIPNGAFTIYEFAEKAGISYSVASKFLMRKTVIGKLVRAKRIGKEGKQEWAYWESKAGGL